MMEGIKPSEFYNQTKIVFMSLAIYHDGALFMTEEGLRQKMHSYNELMYAHRFMSSYIIRVEDLLMYPVNQTFI